MVDVIMWTLMGIAIYLAIGYIFVLCAEAYEDGFWLQVVCMLIWPILAITFVICIIYFGCNELYKKIKKLKK
jgi:hypothetical protein